MRYITQINEFRVLSRAVFWYPIILSKQLFFIKMQRKSGYVK